MSYHLSELELPFSRASGPFGPHQFQERVDGTRLYCAWFAGGLRAIDIVDPILPQEVGYFTAAGQRSPQTNDVVVDRRGLVYIVDRHLAFDILEPTA